MNFKNTSSLFFNLRSFSLLYVCFNGGVTDNPTPQSLRYEPLPGRGLSHLLPSRGYGPLHRGGGTDPSSLRSKIEGSQLRGEGSVPPPTG